MSATDPTNAAPLPGPASPTPASEAKRLSEEELQSIKVAAKEDVQFAVVRHRRLLLAHIDAIETENAKLARELAETRQRLAALAETKDMEGLAKMYWNTRNPDFVWERLDQGKKSGVMAAMEQVVICVCGPLLQQIADLEKQLAAERERREAAEATTNCGPISIHRTKDMLPEPHFQVIVAGGIAVWTGSVWLSYSDDRRVIEWPVEWWARIPTAISADAILFNQRTEKEVEQMSQTATNALPPNAPLGDLESYRASGKTFQERIDDWLASNKKTGEEQKLQHGFFPLGMVGTWIDRAIGAEADRDRLSSDLSAIRKRHDGLVAAISEPGVDHESLLDWLNGLSDTFSDSVKEWIVNNPERIVFLICRWRARIQYALAQPAPAVAEKFQTLAAQWRREQPSHSSRIDKLCGTPAYEQIVAMGVAVVPAILEDLRRKPDHWFMALRKITGASPIKEEHRGRLNEMAADWIEWGESNGLISPKPAQPAPAGGEHLSVADLQDLADENFAKAAGLVDEQPPAPEPAPSKPEQAAFVCPKCGATVAYGSNDPTSTFYKFMEPLVCDKKGCPWSGTWAEVQAAKAKAAQPDRSGDAGEKVEPKEQPELVVVHAKTVDGKPLTAEQAKAIHEHINSLPTDTPSEIGTAIQELRIYCGLGLRQFAEKCGFIPSDMADLEHGRTLWEHLTSSRQRRILVELGKAAVKKRKREDQQPAPVEQTGQDVGQSKGEPECCVIFATNVHGARKPASVWLDEAEAVSRARDHFGPRMHARAVLVVPKSALDAATDTIERLKQRLLTAAGDDLCRLSQEEIKDLTGGKVPIPPRDEFLASCERFHAQVAGESGVNQNCLTLAQLIAENADLEAKLAASEAAAWIMREALRSVSEVPMMLHKKDSSYPTCPICKGRTFSYQPIEHDSTCIIGQALASDAGRAFAERLAKLEAFVAEVREATGCVNYPISRIELVNEALARLDQPQAEAKA